MVYLGREREPRPAQKQYGSGKREQEEGGRRGNVNFIMRASTQHSAQ